MEDIITLVGPRSVGKSTIGRIMADFLGWRFIDVDQYMNHVLKEEGGIPGFTVTHGWNKYMDRLHIELKELMGSIKDEKIVLDCGGGTISSEFSASKLNAKLLKRHTKIILILPHEDEEKGIQILFEREKERAHFKNWDYEKLMNKVRDDYFNRVPGMKEFAHHLIHIKQRSPRELASIIIKLFNVD